MWVQFYTVLVLKFIGGLNEPPEPPEPPITTPLVVKSETTENANGKQVKFA